MDKSLTVLSSCKMRFTKSRINLLINIPLTVIELDQPESPAFLPKDLDFLIIHNSNSNHDNIEFARQVKREHPHIHIILYVSQDSFKLQYLLGSTVSAFLDEHHDDEELLICIELISEGYRYICVNIRKKLAGIKVLNHDEMNQIEIDRIMSLTQREQQVLQLLKEGKTNEEISNELFISKYTLHNHKTNIRNKLKLKSNTEILKYALENKESIDIYITR